MAVCESGRPEVDRVHREQVEQLEIIAKALMVLHKYEPNQMPFVDDGTISVHGVGHVSWYGFGWTFVKA